MGETREYDGNLIQSLVLNFIYSNDNAANLEFIYTDSTTESYELSIPLNQLLYVNYTVYIDSNNNKELIIFRIGIPGESEYLKEYTIYRDYDVWDNLFFVSANGLPITNVRAYRVPLQPEEIKRHLEDSHSWGVANPIDEQYLSSDLATTYQPEYKEDIFDGEFSDFPWDPNPLSRNRRLLKSSYDSFGLRDKVGLSEYNWYNTVTPQFIELENEIINFSTDFKILDPRWDESSNTDKVIADLNNIVYNKDDVELNISDWRFGIEYSPTSALDWDQLRGMSTMRSIDNWVGAPENMWADVYPDIEEYRKIYFERKFGSFEYLHLMKLHRWLYSNLRNTIEKLLPYNISYLGFNNVIEPHATERCKVKYSGSDRFLTPQNRLSPAALILSIIETRVNRF
jgi:hypothetical protein